VKTKKLMVGKCRSGKRTYSTRARAKADARYLTNRFGHFLRAYRCPECGHYHLSKNRPRNWKAVTP
jgi:hypothetical protein